MRPGRLDRLIYVPLPDYETRLQILKIQFEKIPTRDVLIEAIAKRTDGYSGAEVFIFLIYFLFLWLDSYIIFGMHACF